MRIQNRVLVGCAAALTYVQAGMVAPASASHLAGGIVPTVTYNVACATSAPFTGPQCQTDNEIMTVFRGSTLSAAASGNITTSLNSWYDITTLNVVYEVAQVTTGTAKRT